MSRAYVFFVGLNCFFFLPQLSRFLPSMSRLCGVGIFGLTEFSLTHSLALQTLYNNNTNNNYNNTSVPQLHCLVFALSDIPIVFN